MRDIELGISVSRINVEKSVALFLEILRLFLIIFALVEGGLGIKMLENK